MTVFEVMTRPSVPGGASVPAIVAHPPQVSSKSSAPAAAGDLMVVSSRGSLRDLRAGLARREVGPWSYVVARRDGQADADAGYPARRRNARGDTPSHWRNAR